MSALRTQENRLTNITALSSAQKSVQTNENVYTFRANSKKIQIPCPCPCLCQRASVPVETKCAAGEHINHVDSLHFMLSQRFD